MTMTTCCHIEWNSLPSSDSYSWNMQGLVPAPGLMGFLFWEMSGSYKHLCFFLSVMLSSHSVFTKRNLLADKSAWAALLFNSLLSELLCWCCRMVRRQAVNHHMHLAVFVWSLFSQPLSLATYKDNECKMVLRLLLKSDAQLKEKVVNLMLCGNQKSQNKSWRFTTSTDFLAFWCFLWEDP